MWRWTNWSRKEKAVEVDHTLLNKISALEAKNQELEEENKKLREQKKWLEDVLKSTGGQKRISVGPQD